MPVIVRIAGSSTIADRATKVVAVARWLADHDMPSVRLLRGISQPLEVTGHRVTMWQRVDGVGPAPTGRDLGNILRRYHELPPPAFELPPWRPIEGIRKRITEQDVLSPEDFQFLARKCDEMECLLGKVSYVLPLGPIHGDSFVGNLIASQSRAVICDFDSAANGPREWDLTPVAVGKLRFFYAVDNQRQLADAYGVDILRWPDFDVLRQLRELQLVTSVLPVLRTNLNLLDQWTYRLATFRDGDHNAKWTPY